MTKIFCFGDSWAYGSELGKNEYPFVHWVAKLYNCPYKNFGIPGSGLGVILHTLIQVAPKINNSDIVLLVIPPDARWYDQDNRGFYTLGVHSDSELNLNRNLNTTWIGQKTLEWFRYHHSLFIYTIQKILDDIGCKYILMHNYGTLDYKSYHLKIDKNKFLSEKSLTQLLNSDSSEWNNYSNNIISNFRPPPEIFKGIFFEGCKSHPNEKGHIEIAKYILYKLKTMD
jgi:hypothetical protein